SKFYCTVSKSFVLASVFLFLLTIHVSAEDTPSLDLHSIPISDWLNAGEHSEIPWTFSVHQPYLRIDQRLEVPYFARISGKDLNRSGDNHELFLINRISSSEGEWLNEPNIIRHSIEDKLANSVQAEFQMHVVVQPGDYILWAVLYDRKTGKHNVAKRRLRVPELRSDPLPDLYRRMPLVEFPVLDDSNPDSTGLVNGQLYLPVHNKRPLEVELI